VLYNITIRNNINSTAINANNSDVKVSSATIYDNIGPDYFLILFTDVSTILLQDVTIRRNYMLCLLYAERTSMTIVKTFVRSNFVDGYRYSMLQFVDTEIVMNRVSIQNNNETDIYQGNLEFVRSKVSLTDTSVVNNIADLGPNLYVTNSSCIFSNVSFFYNQAYNLNRFSRTIEVTNSKIVLYNNTKFYGNVNICVFYDSQLANGYLIISDESLPTTLQCDKSSILCHDDSSYMLYGKLKSNCTFSDQCVL
jgi:hypothetical protein